MIFLITIQAFSILGLCIAIIIIDNRLTRKVNRLERRIDLIAERKI